MSAQAIQETAERGLMTRQEFGASQAQRQAETSIMAVAAREEAIIKAEYVMAERHPRVWLDVRGQMLEHCKRPRFAEVSRYCKPVGKALVNGEWVEQKARGFTIRFAETLAQEMGNVKPWAATTFEDDRIRIIRAGVTDLQRNVAWSQEITVAKVVEKRGKRKGDEWLPPDGREVLSSRINTRNEPVFLVAATDDEIQIKQNSAISKAQRNFILKLCPRDILEDCEDQIAEKLASEDKKDPRALLKKYLDRFSALGVMASDLITYIGKPTEQWGEGDFIELRELGTAIKEGETTFQQAMKIRFADPEQASGPETDQEHDARLQRQMKEQGAKERARKRNEERIAEATAANESRGQEPATTGQENPVPEAASDEPPAADRANDAPAPPSFKEELRAALTTAGRDAFYRALGAAGYESIEQVPDAKTAKGIIEEALQATKQPAPQRKLTLGDRRQR